VGKRRRAREMAMQMLYQREFGGSSLSQIFAGFDLGDYLRETETPAAPSGEAYETPDGARGTSHPPANRCQVSDQPDRVAPERVAPDRVEIEDSFAYARQLVEGTIRHGEAIDALIRQFAENWRLERMPPIDRNILRLAIYEMLYEESVPKVVIVDEAIELAKKFGSEHSGRFVNGLLDGVLKSGDSVVACGGPT